MTSDFGMLAHQLRAQKGHAFVKIKLVGLRERVEKSCVATPFMRICQQD